MIFRALAKRQPSTPEVLRASALRSALILRDCSFRAQSSIAERRACRILMRQRAAQWRHPP